MRDIKPYRSLCICLVFLLIHFQARSQKVISGRVQDATGIPIGNANVLLHRLIDSALVIGTVTDGTGIFKINLNTPGKYFLRLSSVGFEDRIANYDSDQTHNDLGDLVLEKNSVGLKAVEVVSRKPLLEQHVDRLVVNVKNSITNIGSTVLDVLEKSPGIMVNRSAGSITMAGKSGVMLMINGKQQYVSGEALVQRLQSINAANVEKIELITTPPAQFDAEGNAGIINIQLLENPDQGFSGSFTVSMAAGPQKGTKPMFSTNFNIRNSFMNIYANYSFNRQTFYQPLTVEKKFYSPGKEEFLGTESWRDYYQPLHDLLVGADFQLNKKNILGVLFSTNDRKWVMDAVNTSVDEVNNIRDSTTLIYNDEINHWKNRMFNINHQYSRKEGEVISANIDYLWYDDDNPINYRNEYYAGYDEWVGVENTLSHKKTRIDVLAAKLDYSKKLNSKNQMDLGVKAAFSKFNNDVLVAKEINDDWIPQEEFTGDYFLDEKIFAAYTSLDHKIDEKTNVKVGLRYEYTFSNLSSNKEADIVDRKYGNLFPTFYLSRKLGNDHSINFSYSKRINRPAFTDLAPFLIFIDPRTYVSGNSAIQPAISHNGKIDFLVKRFVFSLSYSSVTNEIGAFQSEFDTAAKTQTIIAQNLDKSDLVYLSATVPFTVTKWWTGQVFVAYNWQKVKTDLKTGPIEISQGFVELNGTQTFRFPKDFSFEMFGSYNSTRLLGSSKFLAFGQLNLTAQKKFNKGKYAVAAGVDDVFSTFFLQATTELKDPDIWSYWSFRPSLRMYKLSFSMKIGNNSLKAKRDRATAAEEEKGRVK